MIREDWTDVTTIEDCEETATVDFYSEDECLSGWFTCLDEIFEGVEKVEILGQEVRFLGLDFSGKSIVAICGKGREKIKVSLESVEFINISNAQKLWLESWLKCKKNY